MPFAPTRSPIQRDEKQLAHLVTALEDTFHGDITVVGIAEYT